MVWYSVRNKCRLWFRLDPIVVSNGRKSGEEVSIEGVLYEISKVYLLDDLWVRYVFSKFIRGDVAIPVGGDVVYDESGHKN